MDSCTNCNGPLPTTHGCHGPEGHEFCDACADLGEALGIGARLPTMLYEAPSADTGKHGWAKVWTGGILGTIVHKRHPARGRLGAVRFRVRMLDGSMWHGSGPSSNGNYIRLRPMAGE